MKFTCSRALVVAVVFGGATLVCPGLVSAQAPPGPITLPPSAQPTADTAPPPPPPPRYQGKPTILGTWKLNRDESDDGRAKLQQAQQAQNGRQGGGGRVGGGWPGGYPGGGYPRGGGYPGGGGRGGYDSYSDADLAKLGDLLYPSYNLTVAQKENEVELNDEQGRKRALFTDGRKLQAGGSDVYREIAAKWNGDLLTTSEDGPRKDKIERVLSYSEGGAVLFETFRIVDSKGNPKLNVRYVYDRDMRAGSPQSPAKQ